jgi:two-component system response regulator AtoC
MRAVERVIANIADTDVPVLIVGESGTGKRAAAYQIHLRSVGSAEPFVNVHCASLTPNFFLSPDGNGNHGAKDDSGGGAESMNVWFLQWGTVLLEEIGELDAVCQPKLLHALQAMETSGAGRGRLISSSKKNLDQEVRNGRFREDLYYRMNGVCLRIPPLRHRKEDIPELLDHFLAKYAALFQRPRPVLSADTLVMLQEYAWPGNIRELENTARAMVAMEDEGLALAALRRAPVRRTARTVHEGLSLKEAARAASRQAERELILKVLSRTRWNRKRAAQELQISYKALLYKLKQIGMDDCATS